MQREAASRSADLGRRGSGDAPQSSNRSPRAGTRPPFSAPALALAALCLVGLAAVFLRLAALESDAERAAEDFVGAWERSDYPAMHALLTPGTRRRTSAAGLARAYERARETATTTEVRAGKPEGRGDEVLVPIAVNTRAFGRIRGEIVLPVPESAVAWSPHLVFPGLKEGERLRGRTQAPRRAAILDRTGKPIVSGPASARQVRALGGQAIAGAVGKPQTPAQREEANLRGLPPDAPIGLFGLESMLEREVAGKPGGVLLAGTRRIGASPPRPAPGVRSTIDTGLQALADRVLADRLGGIAVLDAETAEVRALSGLAFSGPQPPGSTFKIVTATAALERRVVELSTSFPVKRGASVGGGWIENADGEACGGDLVESFAHSCNSVFAPLGVRVGAEQLVDVAERYGFNERPSVRGARASTLPTAAAITSKRELGATAIGQGRILATPLQLASMAQAVASEGRRLSPTVLADGPGRAARQVTAPAVARAVGSLMAAVVERGTGRRAGVKGLRVAGKTGTAELGGSGGGAATPTDTDAWFAAYAPAERPRIALAIMLVRQGQGGETAAPLAREILTAGVR